MRAHPAKSKSCLKQHGTRRWVGDDKPKDKMVVNEKTPFDKCFECDASLTSHLPVH